jgi:hypothetical protein
MAATRLAAAVLAASLTCGLAFASLYAIGWVLQPRYPNWHGPLEVLGDFLSIVVIYGLSGLCVSCVLGVPGWLLYRRLGWRSRFAYALGGFAIGAIAAILWSLNQGTSPVVLSPFTAGCAVAGAAAALVFRLVIGAGNGANAGRLPVV